MGCNCGKKKVASQPKKIVRQQTKPVTRPTSSIKRVIRRSAY